MQSNLRTEQAMTQFEERLRWAIEMSKVSYSHLGRLTSVHPNQISRFMRGEITLNGGSIGRIIDILGCKLGPPMNRIEPPKNGRPKIHHVSDLHLKAKDQPPK
jgi:hypothetical protein